MAKHHFLHQFDRLRLHLKASQTSSVLFLQISVYVLLVAGLLLGPVLWPLVGSPVFWLSVAIILLSVHSIWLSLRHLALQGKVQRLEGQVRTLQAKRASMLPPQPLAHLEVDDLFAETHTRH